MTKPETALREFAEKWGYLPDVYKYEPETAGVTITMGTWHRDKEGCLSDLTALISEGYIERTKYNELLQQRDELREALAEMIWQFGYRSTYEGRESLHTGGLSALESAFGALGLSDPIALLDFEAAIKNTETK